MSAMSLRSSRTDTGAPLVPWKPFSRHPPVPPRATSTRSSGVLISPGVRPESVFTHTPHGTGISMSLPGSPSRALILLFSPDLATNRFVGFCCTSFFKLIFLLPTT
ncbi:hypothetical protein NP493_322g01021 [Ridgeia piscesae]|uniref:Uncharacterized protein n=1 Tax=Ridgeia piscesae TaxID=27915 RepID=A0AAD9L5B2_RIDPI|nr:hypothetical protein NP493_322g01021 [Ridgeia piscesae]